jgi:hypothetical protein
MSFSPRRRHSFVDSDSDPAAFVLRAVAVAPGDVQAFDEGDWLDAIVVVKRGVIELECVNGTTYRFHCGDLLWLTGLPLRSLHNPGHEPALLVAVSRR